MNAPLQKTRIIMKYDENNLPADESPIEELTFVTLDRYEPFEDRSDNYKLELWFPRSTWEDMGKPDLLTLTIEPGDKLNDDGGDVSAVESISKN